MSTAIFADGNWLLHRAYHAVGKSSNIPHKRVPIMLADWMFSYLIKWNSSHCSVCFDGDNVFRHVIYPEYKIKRNQNRSEYETPGDPVYDLLPSVVNCLNLCGIHVQQDSEYEADDLVSSGSKRWVALNASNKAVIIAKDKDSLQNVTEKIVCFTPGVKDTATDILWTEEKVKSEKGMYPKEFLRYQILVGDKIDNIPSLMPPKKAKQIVTNFPTLKDYFAIPEGQEFYKKNRGALILNKMLVTMVEDSWKSSFELIKVTDSRVNNETLIETFGRVPAGLSSYRAIGNRKTSIFGARK
jgi:5'-3' exonuclease